MKNRLILVIFSFWANQLFAPDLNSQANPAKLSIEEQMTNQENAFIDSAKEILKEANDSLDTYTNTATAVIKEISDLALKEPNDKDKLETYLENINTAVNNFQKDLQGRVKSFKASIEAAENASTKIVDDLGRSSTTNLLLSNKYSSKITNAAMDYKSKIDTELSAKFHEVANIQASAVQKINNAIANVKPSKDINDYLSEDDPIEAWFKDHWEQFATSLPSIGTGLLLIKSISNGMARYYARKMANEYDIIDAKYDTKLGASENLIVKGLTKLSGVPKDFNSMIQAIEADHPSWNPANIWKRGPLVTELGGIVKNRLGINDEKLAELISKSGVDGSTGNIVQLCKNYKAAYDRVLTGKDQAYISENMEKFNNAFKDAYDLGKPGAFRRFELADFYKRFTGKEMPNSVSGSEAKGGEAASGKFEPEFDPRLNPNFTIDGFTVAELERTRYTDSLLYGPDVDNRFAAREKLQEIYAAAEKGQVAGGDVAPVGPSQAAEVGPRGSTAGSSRGFLRDMIPVARQGDLMRPSLWDRVATPKLTGELAQQAAQAEAQASRMEQETQITKGSGGSNIEDEIIGEDPVVPIVE